MSWIEIFKVACTYADNERTHVRHEAGRRWGLAHFFSTCRVFIEQCPGNILFGQGVYPNLPLARLYTFTCGDLVTSESSRGSIENLLPPTLPAL